MPDDFSEDDAQLCRRIASGGMALGCNPRLLCLAEKIERATGSVRGHEPDVLPQGMLFTAAELLTAYHAGAESARAHHPVSDSLISRSADAYVKLKHLERMAEATRLSR